MPAYLIAEHIVTDPAKFEEYRIKAAAMIAPVEVPAIKSK